MKNYLHQDVGFRLFKDIVNQETIPLKELFEIHHTSVKRAYEFFKLHFGVTPGVLRKQWRVAGVRVDGQYDRRWSYGYDGTPETVEPDFTEIARDEGSPHDRVVEIILDDVRISFPQTSRHPFVRYGPYADEHILMSNPSRTISVNHQAQLRVDVRYGKTHDAVRMYLVDNYERPLALDYTLSVEYRTRQLRCVPNRGLSHVTRTSSL